MTHCPICGGDLATTTTPPEPRIVNGQDFYRPAPPVSLEAMRETGLCFSTPDGSECARERRIGRDADGNVHESVAPATKIAFAQGPRVARRAR